MQFPSLRAFAEAAKEIGESKTLRGVDPRLEVGALAEVNAQTNGPMLMFEGFEGYNPRYRVAANTLYTPRRTALALGFDLDKHPMEWIRAWREKKRHLQPRPPELVATGPVFENRQENGRVDLTQFPVPHWHEGDGGAYIGTGHFVLVRHPDTGWVNLGVYRACLKGPDLLSIWIIQAKHGRIIAEEYWKRGQACPVALVLGSDPLTWLAAASPAGYGESEYGYAGALHGAPVPVVEGPLTGLPFPAEAEIVLEGEIPPPEEQSIQEGPFGEWPGYYAHTGMECVVRVKQVHFRDAPILHGAPPMKPTISINVGLPRIAADLWDHLERSGITDVTGVWGFCNTLLIVISLKQRYAGHAKQALLSASGFRATASMYRYYVAVDDDIDASDLNDVLWALCTRTDPAESIDILRHTWTSQVDPMISPEKMASGNLTMGRALIDACKPFSWRAKFPSSNVTSPDLKKAVIQKWQHELTNLQRLATS